MLKKHQYLTLTLQKLIKKQSIDKVFFDLCDEEVDGTKFRPVCIVKFDRSMLGFVTLWHFQGRK